MSVEVVVEGWRGGGRKGGRERTREVIASEFPVLHVSVVKFCRKFLS